MHIRAFLTVVPQNLWHEIKFRTLSMFSGRWSDGCKDSIIITIGIYLVFNLHKFHSLISPHQQYCIRIRFLKSCSHRIWTTSQLVSFNNITLQFSIGIHACQLILPFPTNRWQLNLASDDPCITLDALNTTLGSLYQVTHLTRMMSSQFLSICQDFSFYVSFELSRTRWPSSLVKSSQC